MQFGDCHIHIFMDGYDYPAAVKRYENGPDEADIRSHLKIYRDLGVTYLRDGGDHFGASVLARKLAPEYGIEYRSPIFAIHKKGCYGKVVGFSFETIREYRELVDKVAAENGDFIKIMASGILDFDRYESVSSLNVEENLIHEMVHIAHESGFSVMVHVNTAGQIRSALEAGCDSVEHGYYMDDECRKIFPETGAVWVPTVSTCCNLQGSGRFDENTVKEISNNHLSSIRKGVEAGIHIAPGSDAGAYMVPHGKGLETELALLRQSCADDPALLSRLERNMEESFLLIRKKFRRS